MSSAEQPIRLPGQISDVGPDYPRLPSEMHTYVEPELDGGLGDAQQQWLAGLARGLEAQRADAPSTRIALDHLDPARLAALDRLLGRGEVRASVLGQPELHWQESMFTGLWRLRVMDPQRGCIGQALELGAVPDVLREAARAACDLRALPEPGSIARDVGNAAHLLAEVFERSRACARGAPGQVFNLDLLPLGPADHAWLVEVLGSGPVVVVSEGYGATRMRSTRLADTWWVQYYTSSDALILNTLEVAAIPAVACAADDDLAESATRLRALLDLGQAR